MEIGWNEGAWWERRYSPYSFLTSALDGGEWSASRPSRALPLGKDPGNHCTGVWVGPRASLDTEARGIIISPLPGIEPQSPGPSTMKLVSIFIFFLHRFQGHFS
jgi:hypothetical protein